MRTPALLKGERPYHSVARTGVAWGWAGVGVLMGPFSPEPQSCLRPTIRMPTKTREGLPETLSHTLGLNLPKRPAIFDTAPKSEGGAQERDVFQGVNLFI